MTRTFASRVDDDIELVLLDHHHTDAIHALVLSSLDHLRPWEEIARPDLTREETLEYVTAGQRSWAEGRAVVYRGEIAGVVGARITREVDKAEIGYWLGSAYQGLGIMTRSVRAVVQTLFEDEGMHRVELRTAADNLRSRALAERLGFTLEGTLREAYPIDGVRHDLCIYGRLRPDL
jgi:ribosomal-protein-serine acetyltransferase